MNDDGEDIRAWLGSVRTPPLQLNLSEIVRLGRARMKQRRRFAAGGAAAVVLVAAVVPVAVRAWPVPAEEHRAGDRTSFDCVVTRLPLPAEEPPTSASEAAVDWGMSVRAIDASGHYIVANLTASIIEEPDGDVISAPSKVVLWRDEVPEYLPVLRGNAYATDVNANGVVVGAGEVNGDDGYSVVDRYGWVSFQGQTHELPAPAGYEVNDVVGINEAGDIAGTVARGDDTRRAVVWRRVNPDGNLSQPEFLPAPPVEDTIASDIAEDGTVVGASSPNDFGNVERDEAHAWDVNGVRHDLSPPAGTTGPSPRAVTGEWVVGTTYVPVPADDGGTIWVAVVGRWNLRTGTAEVIDTGVAPEVGNDVFPVGVSVSGDVLISDHLSAPRVLRGGQWFSLPVEGAGGFPSAEAMSGDGTLFAGFAGDSAQPVVWHC